MTHFRAVLFIVLLLVSMSLFVAVVEARHHSSGAWNAVYRERGVTGTGTWNNGVISGQLSNGRMITGTYEYGEAYVHIMTPRGIERRHFDYNDCRFRSYGWGIRGSYC